MHPSILPFVCFMTRNPNSGAIWLGKKCALQRRFTKYSVFSSGYGTLIAATWWHICNAFSFTFSLGDLGTFCKFKLNHFASFFMPLHVFSLFAAWLWTLIKLLLLLQLLIKGNGVGYSHGLGSFPLVAFISLSCSCPSPPCLAFTRSLSLCGASTTRAACWFSTRWPLPGQLSSFFPSLCRELKS